MQTRDAIEARLVQMVAHAPDGARAKRLLPQLTIFHDTFDWAAVYGIQALWRKNQPSAQLSEQETPVALDYEEDRSLLDTLVRWEWLTSPSPNRFVLNSDGLKDLFPPSNILYKHYFVYYRRLHGIRNYNEFKPARDALVTPDWPNVLGAIQWGFKEAPDDAFEFLGRMVPYIKRQIPVETRIPFCQQVDKAAHRVTAENSAKAFETVGDLADQDGTHILVYTAYERAMGLDESFNQRILYKLKTYARKQEDFKRELSFLKRIAAIQGLWRPAPTLRQLGDVSGRLNDMAAARNYFARAMSTAQGPEETVETLWAWGRTEYQFGDTQAGCRLCRLAIVQVEEQIALKESQKRPPGTEHLSYMSDLMDNLKSAHWPTMLKRYTTELAAMTCDEESHGDT